MQTLESKQKYLRQKIPENEYQKFESYLQENVGNFDIQKWSGQFITQIVHDFLQYHKDDVEEHERSFYNYQLDNNGVESSPADRFKNKPKEEVSREELKISKAETSSVEIKPKSAMSLLDSVFEKNNNKFATNAVQIKQELYPLPKEDKAKQLSSFNMLQTGQFWSSSGANSRNGNKLSKSNVDFTTFDFWSQPQPKSVNQFKSVSFQSQGSKHPLHHPVKNSNVPNFDELLKISKNEVKAPSPYLKKNYAQEKIATPAIKIGKVIYDGQIVLKTQFKDKVKCFQSVERKEFKSKDIFVIIEGHQIINRTFLMPDYVMYAIRVQPLDILIKRNYEDFSKLRQSLADFYPGTKLAFLEKNSWFSSTSLENVKRQKMMLEFFLNDLIKDKQICNSRILEDFLTIPEHKKMKRKFEEFQKLQKPKCIEELCLLQGRVSVNLSENQRLYQQNLKKYQQRMIDFLQRHQKLSEILAQQFKAIGDTLQNLVSLSGGLIDETCKFNERVFGLQLEGVEEIFKTIRNTYLEEKKVASFNFQTITNTVLPFLNFEIDNLKEFNQLISTQQSFFRAYLKRSEIEKVDGSIPYTSDKIKTSKISVDQQSRSILVLKYQAGYYSNQVCHEAKRIFETLASKYKDLWAANSLKKQGETLRSLQFWKSICGPS